MKKYKVKFRNTDGKVVTSVFHFMSLRQVSQFEQQEGIEILTVTTYDNQEGFEGLELAPERCV